jgi:HEAT repeat protein
MIGDNWPRLLHNDGCHGPTNCPGHFAMPLKSSSQNMTHMRTKAFAALVAALLFALFCVHVGAQRNTGGTQKSDRTKHVIVRPGADTAQGSRVTITSDDSLKDYSAYRSGDRFVVVLPKSSASAVARGAGKGYSDVQVQQRGSDVVVSYRIAPGAKPSITQKFNRLEVVFNVPGGAQANASADANAGKTPTQTPPTDKNQATQNPSAGQSAASQNTATNAVNDRRAAQPAGNDGQTTAGTTPATTSPVVTTPPVGTNTQPTDAGQPLPEGSQPPQTAPTPAPTADASQQVAQNQPRGTIAPITNTSAPSQGGFSLGTFLYNNWAVALIIALVVVGFGLIVAARRTETEAAPPSPEKSKKDAALEEARASLLEAASAATTLNVAESKTVAETEAVTVPVVPAAVETEEAKDEETWDEELAIVGEPETETPAVEASTVETPTVEESTVETPSVEESTVETPVEAATVETSTVETPAVGETAVDESVAEETTAIEPAFVESAVEEVAVESAPVVAEAAKGLDAVSNEDAVSTETVSSATEIAPATEASVKGIALAGALEQENVQDEARRLLEGESYNGAVIGTSDQMARQLIAAELLSALSGRNYERRERARVAFIEYGYFDEKVRDLSEAEAPAERAAAARSLAIVGDRAATPHLIAALGDESVDVRRASVEALGDLRDPAAVVLLEALLERERQERIRIPPRIIRNAIEFCREAAQAPPAPQAPTVEPTSEAVGVSEEETTPVVETAPSFVEEAHALVDETRAAGETEVVGETQIVADEPQAVAEHQAAETGLQPFEESESVVEQTQSTAAEVATFADFIEPSVAEVEQPAPDSEASEATSGGAQIVPFGEGDSVEHAPDADEWIDFNVTAQPFGEPTAVAESSESDFETSSGETLTADITPSEVAPTFEEEVAPAFEEERGVEPAAEGVEKSVEQVADEESFETSRGIEAASVVETATPAGVAEKGVVPFDEHSTVPASIQQGIASRDASHRAAAIGELSHVDSDEAFQQICSAFDDEAKEVRSAAARALYELRDDRAESFTRALREAAPERRRQIGSAISSSGLASEAISQLTGESREKTYEAFSLLFLMAKAGEVHPLIRAIEGHPNNEVRLAVVKLLALSGQKEILPAFRRLAVRGSLPTEVRSAVMEAIYQISSSQPSAA